jgi:hypothetical protein
MLRVCLIVSLSAMTSLLACPPARAEGVRGTPGIAPRGRALDSASSASLLGTSSLVGSFLGGDHPELDVLEGSFALQPPTLSVPPGMMPAAAMLPTAGLSDVRDFPGGSATGGLPRLDLTRLPPSGEPEPSFVDRPGGRANRRPAPEPFPVSRTAFPLLLVELPAASDIRPMVGAVVGVRPAYVRPPSYH